MLNIDPIMCIPSALTELVRRQEARVSFVVSDRKMAITIEQTGAGLLLWQIEVLARSTAPTWHISEYSDVEEIRHQGLATEFCERLIQQAEDAGIKYITAHCPAERTAYFTQMFSAVRAQDIPSEQRVQIFGRTGVEDGAVAWNLESSLVIFICCHRLEISRH